MSTKQAWEPPALQIPVMGKVVVRRLSLTGDIPRPVIALKSDDFPVFGGPATRM